MNTIQYSPPPEKDPPRCCARAETSIVGLEVLRYSVDVL